MKRKRNYTAAAPQLARILWLFLRLRERRCLGYQAVRAELGVSRRTYHRYLATLREAGVRVELDRASGGVRYFCSDPDLASVVASAAQKVAAA